jgi:hypothetical protein
MRRALCNSLLLTLLSVVPTAAQAGWVSQWSNTATKPTGEHMDSQNSAMVISDGRMRLEQPDVITLIDYNGKRFTLLNPAQQVFWSGTVDEYVLAVSQSRSTSMLSKLGGLEKKNPKVRDAETKPYAPPTVDPTKLPPITITKTDVTEKIAGYDTVKYEIRANGELFQEVWVAPALDMSRDLDPGRYFALQRQLGVGMAGKAAAEYNALYASDDYRKLLEKGFILKMVNHHGVGTFERAATSMRQADVPTGQFEVPATYRKVQLTEVLPAPPAGK